MLIHILLIRNVQKCSLIPTCMLEQTLVKIDFWKKGFWVFSSIHLVKNNWVWRTCQIDTFNSFTYILSILKLKRKKKLLLHLPFSPFNIISMTDANVFHMPYPDPFPVRNMKWVSAIIKTIAGKTLNEKKLCKALKVKVTFVWAVSTVILFLVCNGNVWYLKLIVRVIGT